MKQKVYQSLLWGIVLTLCVYALGKTPAFEAFENITWDLRVKALQDPQEHDKNIKLILIDQSALDWGEKNYGLSWPWPREMYAKIVDYCRDHGAKAVIFDILFQEPSLYGLVDDNRFIASIAQANSVGALVLSQKQGDSTHWPSTMEKTLYPILSKEMSLDGFRFGSFPVEPISGAFKRTGFVNSFPERDGVIRRTNLISLFDRRIVPALSYAGCLSTQECAPINDTIPKIIHYHGPSQTYETFNASSIIQSQLMREANETQKAPEFDFNQSYVFIGMSAPGLMDLKSTPMERVYPGTEIHATVLDNVLHRDFITYVPNATTIALLFAFVFATFFWIRYSVSVVKGLAFMVMMLLGSVGMSMIFYTFHLWLNVTLFLTGITVSAFIAFSINYFHEGAQRRFLRSAFSRYISPKIIDELIKHPQTLRLGGRKEVLSILFSDIEGFTSLSTQLDAETLAKFLNEYLGLMSDVILQMGGTIDKYEGDAIIAFWNAPLPQEKHAALAVESVITCQRILEEHNGYFEKKYGRKIKTRFGIHTGEVIVGNLGTEKRFDYTFIGDAGNLASRLESANKQFGSMCMISEETKKYVGDDASFVFRELGTIQVVGRSSAVKVFEPIPIEKRDEYALWLETYNAALKNFYAAHFEEAIDGFEKLSSIDPVSRSYLGLIQNIREAHLRFENGTLILGDK